MPALPARRYGDAMEALAQALDETARRSGFSGAVGVRVAGEEPWARGYGLAHRGLGVPNRPGTRFATASGSKAFTALAVLALVQDGMLGLDTRVRTVLGADLPLVDDAVTVEHLLCHTSGIGDYLDESDGWDTADYVLRSPVHLLADTEAFLAELSGHPQVSPPGAGFAYCNGGYVVLALVAERAGGIGFHDLVHTRVCAPAGLHDTSFLRSDELPGDAAVGYLGADSDRSNVLHLPVRGNGDGGIYTTLPDLAVFWDALMAGRIVPREVVELMLAPRHLVEDEQMRYGMGFWLEQDGPGVVIEGCDAGVSFHSLHDAGEGLTVSIAANTAEGAWPVVRRLRELRRA